jgi:hypothetical protein
MLLATCTAVWCSMLWALAALNRLRGSSAQQRNTCCRQASGSCSSLDADSNQQLVLYEHTTTIQK